MKRLQTLESGQPPRDPDVFGRSPPPPPRSYPQPRRQKPPRKGVSTNYHGAIKKSKIKKKEKKAYGRGVGAQGQGPKVPHSKTKNSKGRPTPKTSKINPKPLPNTPKPKSPKAKAKRSSLNNSPNPGLKLKSSNLGERSSSRAKKNQQALASAMNTLTKPNRLPVPEIVLNDMAGESGSLSPVEKDSVPQQSLSGLATEKKTLKATAKSISSAATFGRPGTTSLVSPNPSEYFEAKSKMNNTVEEDELLDEEVETTMLGRMFSKMCWMI